MPKCMKFEIQQSSSDRNANADRKHDTKIMHIHAYGGRKTPD
ncbi:predicted protein [Plenodomus lingam JN3]|uniref:Predicted protein n=1 Tax=Leptosphaeria maculans (strain JN3 / isolate v23.1.3 / race Av1-4-5-6-7-8) TaxID=985895 RepID=E4ZRJ8_LEPMJ|nr:predicted protein [Plenodomus lingam JN3]CBX93845.1 predicted protein [Plenodomus lingam JN3]